MRIKSFLLGLFIGILTISSPVLAAENSVIKVTGQGKVALKPDICNLEFRIISKDKDQVKALEDNNIRSERLVKSFIEANIKEEDIETSSISIRPVINYEKNQELEGYLVTNSINITIRDIKEIGRYIDLGIRNGGNFGGNLIYSSSKASDAYNEALRLAILDGQKKTNKIAATIGTRVKELIRVEEISRDYYNRNLVSYDLVEEKTSATNIPDIKVGDIIIEASVSLESIY